VASKFFWQPPKTSLIPAWNFLLGNSFSNFYAFKGTQILIKMWSSLSGSIFTIVAVTCKNMLLQIAK